jgi:peptidoglycan/LPS O-acetylase OafA/YrhL
MASVRGAVGGRGDVGVRLPGPGEHVPALDGVRGLAIALVLVFHVGYFVGGPPVAAVDRVVFAGARVGWVGVDLFFVLSGFLITGILFDTKGRPGYFRTFYVRRVLRIFPLYYAALAALLFVLPPLLPAALRPGHPAGSSVWAWAYLTNVRLAWSGWSAMPTYLHHFWSLAVEEQFYLLWPLVVFLLDRRRLVVVCCALIATSVVVRAALHLAGHELAAFMLMPARMDALGTGALIALVMRGPDGVRRLARWAWPIGAASLAALAYVWCSRDGLPYLDGLMQTVGYAALAGVSAALLVTAVTAHPSTLASGVVTWAPLRALGRYSYAIYVIHQPVLLLYERAGLTARALPVVLGSRLPAWLLMLAIGLVSSSALALVSWHVLEKRVLALKSRFEYAKPEPETEPVGGVSAPVGYVPGAERKELTRNA